MSLQEDGIRRARRRRTEIDDFDTAKAQETDFSYWLDLGNFGRAKTDLGFESGFTTWFELRRGGET